MSGFGFGFGFSPLGALLNQDPFINSVDKIYYYWDNAAAGNTRRIRLVSRITGTHTGFEYTIQKQTDDCYEIYDVNKCTLVAATNGDRSEDQFSGNSSGIINNSLERFTFTGTGFTINLLKAPNGGIIRCILYNGDCRGFTRANAGFETAINADKAAGRYYVAQVSGDYSALDASLSSVSAYSLLYYTGSAWVIVPESGYTYVDIDSYGTVNNYVVTTAFTGLPLATYKVGIIPKYNDKNPSSSGYLTFVRIGRTSTSAYFLENSEAYSYASQKTSLVDVNTAHWYMSMRIKDEGQSGDSEWIPGHGGFQTLLYGGVYDMHNFIDGVEQTGFNTGDQAFVEITQNYTLVNTTYAVHPSFPANYLMLVTTTYVFTKTGWKITNNYKALQNTQIDTYYSYMMPYSLSVFNRFVSDNKEQKTLPALSNTVNISEGNKRKMMLIYNNTVGGANENYYLKMLIANPILTNLQNNLQSTIYSYGSTYGKVYLLAAQNIVLATDDELTTEVNFEAGFTSGLIDKVVDYL